MDALPAPAPELVGCAGVQRLGPGLVAALLQGLVRAVLTVGMAVADPQLRDAHAVVALELAGAADQGRALSLVAAIAAVIVAVAHKDHGNAGLVAALKLTGDADWEGKTQR